MQCVALAMHYNVDCSRSSMFSFNNSAQPPMRSSVLRIEWQPALCGASLQCGVSVCLSSVLRVPAFPSPRVTGGELTGAGLNTALATQSPSPPCPSPHQPNLLHPSSLLTRESPGEGVSHVGLTRKATLWARGLVQCQAEERPGQLSCPPGPATP